MNGYYIADDGTIHAYDSAPGSADHTNAEPIYEVSAGRKIAFYVFSVISVMFVVSLFMVLSEWGFDLGDNGLYDFFEKLIPLGVIVGAIIGAMVNAVTVADENRYNLWSFLLAPVLALLGAFICAAVLCLIPMGLMAIGYILVAVLLISALFGALS